MADLKVKREVVEQLDRLPVELRRRVLMYAKELAGSRPKGRSGNELLKFAGTVDKESARHMRGPSKTAASESTRMYGNYLLDTNIEVALLRPHDGSGFSIPP